MQMLIKKTLWINLFIIISAVYVNGQAPGQFNYQAMALNASDLPYVEQDITVQFSILQGDPMGHAVYVERHQTTTSKQGIFSLKIGSGTVQSGDFKTILWAKSGFWLKVEVDFEGGENFTTLSTSKFISVPYALHAESVTNVDDADADTLNEIQLLTKAGNKIELSHGGGQVTDEVEDADADPMNEIQILTKTGSIIELSNGGGQIADDVEDADADPMNEIQQINIVRTGYFADVELSLNGGIATLDVRDADADDRNEIQQLSLTGTDLSISQGDTVSLSSIAGKWKETNGGIKYDMGLAEVSNPVTDEETIIHPGFMIANSTLDRKAYYRGHEALFEPSVSYNNIGARYFNWGLYLYRPGNPIDYLVNLDTFSLRFDNRGSFSEMGIDSLVMSNKQSLKNIHLGSNMLGRDDNQSGQLWLGNGYNKESLAYLGEFGDKSGGLLMFSNDELKIAFTSNQGGYAAFFGENDNLIYTSGAKSYLGFDDSIDFDRGMSVVYDANGDAKSGMYVDTLDKGHLFVQNGDLKLYNSSNEERMLINENKLRIAASRNLFPRIDLIREPTLDVGSLFIYGPNNTSNVSCSYDVNDGPNTGIVSVADSTGVVRTEMSGSGAIRGEALTLRKKNYDQVITLQRGVDDEGVIRLYGPNGQPNFSVFSLNLLANSANFGRLAIHDDTGKEVAGFFSNEFDNGKGYIFADVKNFRMDHPTDANKEIWYASLEGPEAGAYTRGTSQLKEGEFFVTFPEHFELVVNPETITIQLTPLDANTYGLAVIEKTSKGFRVKELMNGKGDFKFDWEVKGVRKGYENYEPVKVKKK